MNPIESFGTGLQAVFSVLGGLGFVAALMGAMAAGGSTDDQDDPDPDASWLGQLPLSAQFMFWGFAIWTVAVSFCFAIDNMI
jgi:hypothetical protein